MNGCCYRSPSRDRFRTSHGRLLKVGEGGRLKLYIAMKLRCQRLLDQR
jgi:hypothetical protein